MLLDLISTFHNKVFLDALNVFFTTAPLWLPIILGAIFWRTWTTYTFTWWEKNQDHVLLEIKLPREIQKTPLAMEIVLSTLHQTSGETTFIDRYWFGKRRVWFSLEFVSSGGEVHFYVWTRAFFKNIVESAIYSQYPEVEIYEVEDYASSFHYDAGTTAAWGAEFQLTKPDPYPIKTYIDYGLDKPSDKEELKIDPISPLLEYLGSCHAGGQIWIQILIQSHKKDKHKKGSFFKKTTWRSEAEDLVDDILKRERGTKVPAEKSVGGFPAMLTKVEEETADAIMRSVGKLAYNVGIRGVYIAPLENFNPVYIVGLLSCMKQFSSNELNGFAPANRWHIIFDYPWQFENLRAPRMARKLLNYYKRRSYFHPPYKQRPFILTTEELATIYHFPGGVVTTPTLGRVMSRKAEPPSNLPI